MRERGQRAGRHVLRRLDLGPGGAALHRHDARRQVRRRGPLPSPPTTPSRCPARPPAARYGVAPICSGLGSLGKQPTVDYIGGVLEITLRGGTTEWCDGTASVTYRMTCSGHDDPPFPPEPVVEVHGNCSFSVDWRHPSICSAHSNPAGCSRPAPPAPPPAVCLGCLPPWKVTRCSILRTMCPT